jgi:hypothetical protein
MIRTEIGSLAPNVSRKGAPPLRIQIPLPHHRADQAGAVLSVVNALRFASTRPAAGPSGIDDACARHDVGYCAMAGFLMTRAGREKRVDAGFPQAYLDVSRLCPTAHPPHRTQCMQSALPVVALRARFKRTPHNIASGCYAVTLRVNRRAPDSRSHGLSSAHRLEGRASLRVAFTEAHARPSFG